MKKNLDAVDRLIRFVIFGFLLSVSYAGMDLPTWVHTLAFVPAIVLLFTILTGYCPIYALLGFSTREQTSKE